MLVEQVQRPDSGRVAAWTLRVLACLVVASAGICSAPATAQQVTAPVRIVLADQSGAAIPGALVAAIDSGDRVLAEGLTNPDGRRTLLLPRGSYRLRVKRIGFQPFLSEVFATPRDDEVRLTVTSPSVTLRTVRVSARRSCRAEGRESETLATVWEEVSKALRASQLSRDDLAGLGRVLVYRREIRNDGAVLSSDTSIRPVMGRPFRSVEPATLAREGYVRGDELRGWEFFGPDEAVLLSDEFAATHCFRLVRDPTRPGEIGVAFDAEPRRTVSDISGVLWLDEGSAELREVRFGFVATGVLRSVKAGGHTKFRRMPSGAWIVEDWELRMPRLQMVRGRQQEVTTIGYVEAGGRVLTDEPTTNAQGGTSLTGRVFDSLAMRPLAGAVVTFDRSANESPVSS